jgi:hypothetical protein
MAHLVHFHQLFRRSLPCWMARSHVSQGLTILVGRRSDSEPSVLPGLTARPHDPHASLSVRQAEGAGRAAAALGWTDPRPSNVSGRHGIPSFQGQGPASGDPMKGFPMGRAQRQRATGSDAGTVITDVAVADADHIRRATGSHEATGTTTRAFWSSSWKPSGVRACADSCLSAQRLAPR